MIASLEELNRRFTDEVQHVDALAQIVLKGHLVLEVLMTESIQTFLLHGDKIEDARLSFAQKLVICRAISTSEQNNNMWNLIAKINALRNALSHSLGSSRRAKATEELWTIYKAEFSDMPDATDGIPNNIEKDFPRDSALCLYAIGGCIGWLHAHLSEVKRLKETVLVMDAAMNGGALSKK